MASGVDLKTKMNPEEQYQEHLASQCQDVLSEYNWPHLFKFNFGVNRWGSCQYSSALAFYDFYFKLRENLSTEDTLAILGIDVSFDRMRDFDEVKEIFIEYFNEQYKDADHHREEEWKKATIESVMCTVNCDEIFDITNDKAWDLWGATKRIIKICFENFKVKNVPNSFPNSLVSGPIGNQEVQSGNIYTGLCCALLKDYGLVKDERAFWDFDT